MAIAFLLYFVIGLAVALAIARRQTRVCEREIGHWFLLSSFTPLGFVVAIVLWPLWLLLLRLPQPSATPSVAPQSPAPLNGLGKEALVITPLAPTGRVSLDGIYRDARSATGQPIPAGATVVVCATSVGRELIVREAGAAPGPTPSPLGH